MAVRPRKKRKNWILCAKRLPPKGKIVMITNGVQVGFGFRGLGGRTNREDKKNLVFYRPVVLDPLVGIKAWQYLPKAPRIKD